MTKILHLSYFTQAIHRLGFIALTFFSLLAHQTVIAQTPVSPAHSYQVSIHIWQDHALLSAPKIVAFENELSELIISNPDTLKIAMRVSPHHREGEPQLFIRGEVFLAGQGGETSGQWIKIGAPQITTYEQERTNIELDVSNYGLTHKNGHRVKTLKLSILIEK